MGTDVKLYEAEGTGCGPNFPLHSIYYYIQAEIWQPPRRLWHICSRPFTVALPGRAIPSPELTSLRLLYLQLHMGWFYSKTYYLKLNNSQTKLNASTSSKPVPFSASSALNERQHHIQAQKYENCFLLHFLHYVLLIFFPLPLSFISTPNPAPNP